ncbi:hypothetical protein [Pseudomonas fluorescens]|uniref:hypothetical protein n=1 Tax=Pseudomonas fluorescens TaxID=294 RepID=UPI00123EE7C7|nr:hypothetical protein [Pseudomonas fluorescens]
MKLIPGNFDEALKFVVVLGAVVSFFWGVLVWIETRRVESTKPFLQHQLALYIEASKAAAIIATSASEVEVDKSKTLFSRLYWGELALVENADVARAMFDFRIALEARSSQERLQILSLALARACGKSLDKSWGINAWSSPDEASFHTVN